MTKEKEKERKILYRIEYVLKPEKLRYEEKCYGEVIVHPASYTAIKDGHQIRKKILNLVTSNEEAQVDYFRKFCYCFEEDLETMKTKIKTLLKQECEKNRKMSQSCLQAIDNFVVVEENKKQFKLSL